MTDWLYIPFVWMLSYPGAALIPSAVLGAVHWTRGRRLQSGGRRFFAMVVFLWLVYGLYETAMYFWMQTVLAPIRVDLLLIAPTLWALTVAAVAVLLVARRPGGQRQSRE